MVSSWIGNKTEEWQDNAKELERWTGSPCAGRLAALARSAALAPALDRIGSACRRRIGYILLIVYYEFRRTVIK